MAEAMGSLRGADLTRQALLRDFELPLLGIEVRCSFRAVRGQKTQEVSTGEWRACQVVDRYEERLFQPIWHRLAELVDEGSRRHNFNPQGPHILGSEVSQIV